jgi:diamine N-acetyltransferase
MRADNPAVSLRSIDEHNGAEVLDLKVSANQIDNVANNERSLAQAYIYGSKAWPRAIYAGDTPVGLLMLSVEPHNNDRIEYGLWRLMLAEAFQGLGYGKAALDLAVADVRARPHTGSLSASCVPGIHGPLEFYKKYGFVETGEIDDGEIVLSLPL